MALPKRPRSAGSPFGRTLETVLGDRPCRVIITTEPTKRPTESLASAS
jgi:APA family basic amino acid/polyamine antiporter